MESNAVSSRQVSKMTANQQNSKLPDGGNVPVLVFRLSIMAHFYWDSPVMLPSTVSLQQRL